MEEARRMLESGKYNVNEVGLKIGYLPQVILLQPLKRNMAPPQKNIYYPYLRKKNCGGLIHKKKRESI